MSTGQYRALVLGQIAAVLVLGICAVAIFLTALPGYRSRGHLEDAIEAYSMGTVAKVREAEAALDRALGSEPTLVGALALQGRIGLEQGRLGLSTAEAAYRALERALSEQGRSPAPALNGLGCVELLRASVGLERGSGDLKDAYAKLEEVIREDPANGDAHVNAAVSAITLALAGDRAKWLRDAAAHLKSARDTRNLTYESVITYHAAVGLLFFSASELGDAVLAEIANRFGAPDVAGGPPGWELRRAVQEFDKARELASQEQTRAQLRVCAALAHAEVMDRERISREEAGRHFDPVKRALSEHKDLFSEADRQRLLVVQAAAQRRVWNNKHAARWLDRAAGEGTLTPLSHFAIGAVFFEFAERGVERAVVRVKDPRTGRIHKVKADWFRRIPNREARAAKHLRAALESEGLPSFLRFHAHALLAILEWDASHWSAALTHMRQAEVLLKAGTKPEPVARGVRRRFYRDFGIMLYSKHAERDERAAREHLRRALGLAPARPSPADQKNQEALKAFLDKIEKRPVVEDIRAVPGGAAMKLPPSLPILSAKVSSTGPTSVRKQDVRVRIGGQDVTLVLWGPGGRLYALPQTLLPKGEHAVEIIVQSPERGKVQARGQARIQVTY